MRILVTGATAGIGLETARALAGLGHAVVLHGRNGATSAAAVAEVLRSHPHADCTPQPCDLSSLGAVRDWAATLLLGPPLDVVVHNAGVWLNEEVRTVDGHETTWAVNHLAPFLLTQLLLDQLLARPHSRIITVSSIGHRSGRIRFSDPSAFDSGLQAYCQSKLANVLFTQELARRTAGTGLVAHALHPGVVATKLLAATGFGQQRKTSPAEGAATSVFLATDPKAAESSGDYWVGRRRVAPSMTDPALARRLWALSERQVGG